jgi:hypothetical protein
MNDIERAEMTERNKEIATLAFGKFAMTEVRNTLINNFDHKKKNNKRWIPACAGMTETGIG